MVYDVYCIAVDIEQGKVRKGRQVANHEALVCEYLGLDEDFAKISNPPDREGKYDHNYAEAEDWKDVESSVQSNIVIEVVAIRTIVLEDQH